MSRRGGNALALRRLELGPSVRFVIGVALVMILLFPVYWLVVTATEDALSIFHTPPSLFPAHPSLAYFGQVWGVQARHLLTSLIIACGTVVFSLFIALPAGYALSQLNVRWTGGIVMALLVAQMIPNVVLGVPYYLLFEKLHLLNSYEGLVLADSSYAVPFVIVVLRAFLVSFPKEMRESCLVDGGGELRTLVSVVMPLATPAIVTVALFSFLFAWSDFFFALTLTSSQNIQPMTLSLYLYVSNHLQEWNLAMASAVFAAAPSVILLLGAQRYIRSGLTAGAVKG